jgi:hypothetical protein
VSGSIRPDRVSREDACTLNCDCNSERGERRASHNCSLEFRTALQAKFGKT